MSRLLCQLSYPAVQVVVYLKTSILVNTLYGFAVSYYNRAAFLSQY